MKVKSIHFLVAAIALISLLNACKEDKNSEKRFYYSNGVLRKVIAKKNNKWNGATVTYYPTGQIKSKSFWLNDVQHGPAFFYYPNGNLKEATHWHNGKEQGKSLWYRPNGVLERTAYLQAGAEIDNVIFYDSIGKPEELQVYNKQGQVVRVTSYDKRGKPRLGGAIPFVHAKDTIFWGEKFSGYVDFGYSTEGTTTMFIGHMKKNLKLLDTISAIKPSKTGRFYFSYQPNKLGKNVMPYQLLYSVGKGDTAVTIRIGGFQDFFVKSLIVQQAGKLRPAATSR